MKKPTIVFDLILILTFFKTTYKQLIMRLKILLLVVIPFLLFSACTHNEDDNQSNQNDLFGTGWNSGENFSQTIPVAINYGNYQSGGVLPTSVDLTSKFPPIGYQGQLGTCVAWAVGYNNKSYLDCVTRGLSPADMQSSNNQYSPTDLFFSIDPSKRSCANGTNFDDAFNVLITRGVNTLASVPYTEFCYSTSPGNPATASTNTIKNYRRIEGSIDEIKEYLAQGVPVVLGAMVNHEFQLLSGNGVLTNLNYNGNESGHAMVIAGYDDARNAFRIVNSWGYTWGDNGYLWVDYNFLVNKFCVQGGQKSLFVAYNDNTTPINPPQSGSSPDLTALVMSDFTLYPSLSFYINARRAFFDVKNVGNEIITSASNWNIYYLWVDAFNANNYGVIFRGEFTNAIPQNTYQNINSNYTLINFNLSPGASLGQTVMAVPYVSWDYFMPQLNGSYYLVMYIDKGNSGETNQTNNVFYVTQTPKFFSNGYSNKTANGNLIENKHQFDDLLTFKLNLTESDLRSEVVLAPYRKLSKEKFPNAYTSEEIVAFLKYKIKNGGL